MVSAAQVIAEAERLGVRFEVSGERLRAIPGAAITPKLYEAIGQRKSAIIACLREWRGRCCTLDEVRASLVVACAQRIIEEQWR